MEETKMKRFQNLRALATQARRPILTHLNNDTSWLISIPIPQFSSTHHAPEIAGEKTHFHILLDPWLSGTVYQKPEFVASLAHIEDCVFSSISDVLEAITTIESGDAKAGRKYNLDLLLISHHLLDHVGNSLRDVDSSVPVLAEASVAKTLKSWNHFDNVCTLPAFSPTAADWRDALSSINILPPWLGVLRWESPEWFQDLHFAIMITISNVSDKMQDPEGLIYTPHGIFLEDGKKLESANPSIKTLALLHALNISSHGLKGGLGAHNGLALQRMTGAKYWVRTHDEVHKATGIAYWIVYRWIVTLEDALEKERSLNPGKELPKPNFTDLPNGDSMLLL